MADRSTIFKTTTQNIEETEELGVLLGELLVSDFCVTLSGDLGAGKTAFTRGIVDGVTPGEGDFVSSPTYAVCNVYQTAPPVHHYDLYRLEDEDDLESVGFYDSLGSGILIIEWAERIPSVAARADVRVAIRRTAAEVREFTIESATERGAEAVSMLKDTVRKSCS